MDDLPKAVETREATFGGITLRLHFLDNGQRVIEQDGMDKMMRAMQRGTFPPKEAARAARWVKGDA